ncbi:MAG: restriction endonuclease [Alphaproteobacteria bacterium]|nr:restriction endonuclease [Alphaproteobacteria bacterium]
MVSNRLTFDIQLAAKYKAESQRVRVMSEAWVSSNVLCPMCNKTFEQHRANNVGSDFHCSKCGEEFELKARKSKSKKVVDGAYDTMIAKLNSDKNPNLLLLNYKMNEVKDLILIPKYFFTTDIIEKRNKLSIKARRAGWTGCNILINRIPDSGKIYYIRSTIMENQSDISRQFQKTLFLREDTELRGWNLDIMNCIDSIKSEEFDLGDIYKFENALFKRHPSNNYISDKIRQRLQYLRDKKYILFIGNGKYRKN